MIWQWIALILIILAIIIRTKKRGYFWKSRTGEKLTIRQFFKKWGKGIEGITPIQQTRSQLFGTWIVITGMLAGIMINFLTRVKYQWYWIEVILIGSLIITSYSMVGLYQRYRKLKTVDDTMRKLNKESGKWKSKK